MYSPAHTHTHNLKTVLAKKVKTRVKSTAFLPGELSSQVLQQCGVMNNFRIKDTHTKHITKDFIKMYIESRTNIKHIRKGVCGAGEEHGHGDGSSTDGLYTAMLGCAQITEYEVQIQNNIFHSCMY